jgi:hypothetical protein
MGVMKMPKTWFGKLSIILIVAMPVLFFLGGSFTNLIYRSVPAGNTILEDIAARPALALTMLAGMLCGVLSFVSGLIAIAKQKERATVVYISTIIGALLLVFLLGEFLFPH